MGRVQRRADHRRRRGYRLHAFPDGLMSIVGIWARSSSAAQAGLDRLIGALPNPTAAFAQRLTASPEVTFGYVPAVAHADLRSNPVAVGELRLAIVGDVQLHNRPELLATL